MAHSIENSRNHCAFIGALQTVQAIEGVVPIVHSTAGCAVQRHSGGNAIPSSNVIEKQIVFGGSSRLREQIKNTVKVVKADLYAVLPGCATELVGDDIGAMVKEAQEQQFPVIYITAPGFKGDVHAGYELTVKGIVEQLIQITTQDKIGGLVNVLGIIPGQDVFWQGHLLELQSILARVGVAANTLFGFGQNTKAWQQIAQAELNLVFSPWGTGIAKYLKEKFGTPYIEFDSLPVGMGDTLQFLQELQEKITIADDVLLLVKEQEEKRFAYYLEKVADLYFEHNMQKEIAVVGEASLVLGLTSFLSKAFGSIPKALIVTDPLTGPVQASIIEKSKSLLGDFATEVVFEEDQVKINELIRKNEVELILGSSLEQEIARELHIPLVPVAFPVAGAVVLHKSYIGFNGAITLLEDVSSQIVRTT